MPFEYCDTISLVGNYFCQEEIIILEGVREEGAVNPSCLRVRLLTEALPQTRLTRLLQKHKFEKAFEFAQMFNLDTQVINLPVEQNVV